MDKHGKWIFTTNQKVCWCGDATCSSCKTTVETTAALGQDYGVWSFLSGNAYCRACGARMDGIPADNRHETFRPSTHPQKHDFSDIYEEDEI